MLVTIEKRSNLFFHIQRAWLGARMRLALTEAGLAGVAMWGSQAVTARSLRARRLKDLGWQVRKTLHQLSCALDACKRVIHMCSYVSIHVYMFI